MEKFREGRKYFYSSNVKEVPFSKESTYERVTFSVKKLYHRIPQVSAQIIFQPGLQNHAVIFTPDWNPLQVTVNYISIGFVSEA